MSPTRTTTFLALALAAAGCSARETTPVPLDCSVEDAYEFENITDFNGMDSGWYSYADPTPIPAGEELVSQTVVDVDRCGDTRALRLQAHGYNFWGAGFADYGHEAAPVIGTDYEGISFWARTGVSSDRTFMLYIDEGRTLKATRAAPLTGVVVDGTCVASDGIADTAVSCTIYPPAGPDDTDVNGDGLLTPGDIAFQTSCRIPPIQDRCDPACYYGGAQPPAVTTCVPAPDQCGNQFHKYITTTDRWQLFFLPWSELPQWPCPNRLAGGIEPSDIRKFEIKLQQGTSYEIFLDDIAFYRRR